MQPNGDNVENDPHIYDILCMVKNCQAAKANIINGKTNSHHDSRGQYFAFGSRKQMRIDPENHSSVGTYVARKGKEEIAKKLHDDIVHSMQVVREQLKHFVGFDVLKDNSTTLRVSAGIAKKLNISRNFHLQGKTGYTSLFYNVDASTMERHKEMDWAMTTIYVPNQSWENKPKDHLRFLFHLTKEPNGILHISMQPGTILYFHGSLLMHQQVHDGGKCTKKGCCINLSGYANRRLLCHLVATIQRIKKIRKIAK